MQVAIVSFIAIVFGSRNIRYDMRSPGLKVTLGAECSGDMFFGVNFCVIE